MVMVIKNGFLILLSKLLGGAGRTMGCNVAKCYLVDSKEAWLNVEPMAWTQDIVKTNRSYVLFRI